MPVLLFGACRDLEIHAEPVLHIILQASIAAHLPRRDGLPDASETLGGALLDEEHLAGDTEAT